MEKRLVQDSNGEWIWIEDELTESELNERLNEESRLSKDVIITLIEQLKSELASTDYIALKSIEGIDCDSIYPDWKLKRQLLRDKINQLQLKLK